MAEEQEQHGELVGKLKVIGAVLTILGSLGGGFFFVADRKCPDIVIDAEEAGRPTVASNACVRLSKTSDIDAERAKRADAKAKARPGGQVATAPKPIPPSPAPVPAPVPTTKQAEAAGVPPPPAAPTPSAQSDGERPRPVPANVPVEQPPAPPPPISAVRTLCREPAMPKSLDGLTSLDSQLCALAACAGELAETDANVALLVGWRNLAKGLERSTCKIGDREALSGLKTFQRLLDVVNASPIPDAAAAHELCSVIRNKTIASLNSARERISPPEPPPPQCAKAGEQVSASVISYVERLGVH